MSVNNTFNGKRFARLFKQHVIHNGRTLIYSVVGYIGVLFLILSFIQMGNDGEAHDFENFNIMLLVFTGIFGIMYVGYSFPAFRTKEKSFSYLTMPASSLEKVLFEFTSKIIIAFVALPFLFWLTFHLEGYFFELFNRHDFEPIGFSNYRDMDISPVDRYNWLKVIIAGSSLLVFVLPFTGAAMFSKQPLIKTLFSVGTIILSFAGILYIIIEPLGMANYDLDNASLLLLPTNDKEAMVFFGALIVIVNAVLLTVSYLKIKEKEV